MPKAEADWQRMLATLKADLDLSEEAWTAVEAEAEVPFAPRFAVAFASTLPQRKSRRHLNPESRCEAEE